MKTAAFSAAELRSEAGYPRAPDLSDFYAKGRGGLQPGASRDCGPPWGIARKPAAPLGVSHGEVRKSTALPGLLHGEVRKPTTLPGLLHSEARKPTAPPGLLHGEARKPTAPPGLLHGEVRKPSTPLGLLRGEARKPTTPPGLLRGEAAKPTAPPGLLRGEARKPTTAVAFARAGGFSGRAAGRNGALPYNARKSQFLRNGDVWATESLFLFAVLWLAFLPDQSETGVAGGGKARRPETPAAPRRPRPTTATGSRFLRRQRERPPRRPRPSPPAREGSLGAPTTEPFRPAPSGKPERKKERRNPG